MMSTEKRAKAVVDAIASLKEHDKLVEIHTSLLLVVFLLLMCASVLHVKSHHSHLYDVLHLSGESMFQSDGYHDAMENWYTHFPDSHDGRVYRESRDHTTNVLNALPYYRDNYRGSSRDASVSKNRKSSYDRKSAQEETLKGRYSEQHASPFHQNSVDFRDREMPMEEQQPYYSFSAKETRNEKYTRSSVGDTSKGKANSFEEHVSNHFVTRLVGIAMNLNLASVLSLLLRFIYLKCHANFKRLIVKPTVAISILSLCTNFLSLLVRLYLYFELLDLFSVLTLILTALIVVFELTLVVDLILIMKAMNAIEKLFRNHYEAKGYDSDKGEYRRDRNLILGHFFSRLSDFCCGTPF